MKKELEGAELFAHNLKDNPQEIIKWAKSEIKEYEKLIAILEKYENRNSIKKSN